MSFGGFKNWEDFENYCKKIKNCYNECPFFSLCRTESKLVYDGGYSDNRNFKGTFENLNTYYRKQKLEKLLSS